MFIFRRLKSKYFQVSYIYDVLNINDIHFFFKLKNIYKTYIKTKKLSVLYLSLNSIRDSSVVGYPLKMVEYC